MKKEDKHRIDDKEMKYLRLLCGLARMDRLRNETVWRIVDVRENFSDKVDRKVLNWFGYVERMARNK